MKRYFCFHCQQEIEPYKLFKWRFCPKCYHIITDQGDGFYRVCDVCGANMPTDAMKCLKCDNVFDENALVEKNMAAFIQKRKIYDVLIGAAVLCLAFMAAFALFYVSFYVLVIIFIAGIINWLFHAVKK